MIISGSPFSSKITDVSFTPVVGVNLLTVSCTDGNSNTASDSVTFTVCGPGYKFVLGSCIKAQGECLYPKQLLTPSALMYCWFQAGLNAWGYNVAMSVTPIEPYADPNFP